jgi:hypothetical protein
MSEICVSCGTPMRVVSMTSEGTSSRCSCGRLSMTRLNKGELDLGLPTSERAALDDCTEMRGCTSTLHLSTCPER